MKSLTCLGLAVILSSFKAIDGFEFNMTTAALIRNVQILTGALQFQDNLLLNSSVNLEELLQGQNQTLQELASLAALLN
jgi:hypothetical protein